MKFRPLADTGIFVSELCLGAMTFGGRGQMWEVIGGLDQAAVDGIVHRALEAGINFIDTADVYSAGESEVMVGKAIAGRRHDVVLATKVRGRMGPGPNQVGLSRLHIIESIDAPGQAIDLHGWMLAAGAVMVIVAMALLLKSPKSRADAQLAQV